MKTEEKAEFDGVAARPSLWLGLGAREARSEGNGPGRVVWDGYGAEHVREGYALELLSRARSELEKSLPGVEWASVPGDVVVARAIMIRGRDRRSVAMAALGRGMAELASQGLSVTLSEKLAKIVEGDD